ncbi:MAG: protein CapI [Candidatus Komeilibacteria bacterium RIFOXYC1_FULL_37_11]|uniref:Protein CapI n=1 Tax=Candidatus Komeilibacteria bacterium RIFOXYC1_FULL_37_11 TaxID=1798555 RepID=A0A1G2C0D7_9BACT|nr:MAG: protein CapI [Candidatus Komeilibacteria bacterium RIFOXYC1_FULL_37_11]OGY95392.1 MAG: protein CapI [Candidatus Komeilibacteria bacterium RIFOXYD1_FULL_37_29]
MNIKFKKGTSILVTGSAGFIGFHVAKKLLEMGVRVIGIDNLNNYYDVNLKKDRNNILKKYKNYKFCKGDLANLNFIKKVLNSEKIDKVCHLAAQPGVRYSLINPQAYIQSNLIAFSHLIEEVRKHKIKDFIYASSSSVYGKNKKTPFSVEDNVDRPISLYAATKKSNELIAHAYHHLFGINCTGLRFFTVYGPYSRPDMSPIIFSKAISQNQVIKVFNYGKMKRDFTYIDDIVDGVLSALHHSYPYEIFNLGNNRPINLQYFIALLEKNIGQKAKKKLLPMQPGDILSTAADIKNSQKKLGFTPKTPIEEGIKKFTDWYKEYYKKNA